MIVKNIRRKEQPNIDDSFVRIC